MKSLMIKDILILKTQAKTVLLILLVGIMLSFTANSSVYGLGYTAMIFGMVSISTISYDEYDHGYQFLFTLPFSRKEYVVEKYLFSLLCVIIGLIVGISFTVTGSIVKNDSIIIDQFAVNIAIMLAVNVFMICAMIPLRIKYGSENGKIVSALIMGFGFAMAAIVANKVAVSFTPASVHYVPVSSGPIIAVALAVSAVMLIVSGAISLKVIKNKEF